MLLYEGTNGDIESHIITSSLPMDVDGDNGQSIVVVDVDQRSEGMVLTSHRNPKTTMTQLCNNMTSIMSQSPGSVFVDVTGETGCSGSRELFVAAFSYDSWVAGTFVAEEPFGGDVLQDSTLVQHVGSGQYLVAPDETTSDAVLFVSSLDGSRASASVMTHDNGTFSILNPSGDFSFLYVSTNRTSVVSGAWRGRTSSSVSGTSEITSNGTGVALITIGCDSDVAHGTLFVTPEVATLDSQHVIIELEVIGPQIMLVRTRSAQTGELMDSDFSFLYLTSPGRQ